MQHEKAKGTKVTIKLSYSTSNAYNELKSDLAQIELENISKATSMKQHGTSVGLREPKLGEKASNYYAQRLNRGSVFRGSSEMTYRPYSAKTEFYGSYSRNPYNNNKNFSNRVMSSSNIMNQTPSMKTLKRRPQTAASQGMIKSHSSVARFQTMDTRNGVQSITSYQPYNSKKKLRTKVKDLVFEGEINAEGIAVFKNIPKSIYVITVDQSDFFKSSEKEISLALEAESEGMIHVYIPLEKQIAYTTTIYMVRSADVNDHEFDTSQDPSNYEESKDYDEINRNYHTNLELRAILLGKFYYENSKNLHFLYS